MVTSSTNTVLNEILKFNGVESIQARKTYILYEPDTSAALLDNGINAIEPNLTHINADDVWAMGIDGSGLVVANIDTGVRYSHQALVGQYRGNDSGTFDHNYNWFNPDDLGDNVPRDGHGHGTHTMGTMVGDDGGANKIGIAPGAEWMACAGCPDGGCTDTALLGCGQFMAAPTDLTGANPNPDLRPNAVNNSWGDCGQTYDPWYEGPINAWLAAGIYPIFANGNSDCPGYSSPPGLNTVGNPARSGNVTGVGSSGEQNGQYATHSNWGPTDNPDIVNPVAGFENMKPQVIAPGVDIRSSTPGSDTEYQDGWDGTSMSAPHVTGLVALIWQAAPCLIGDYAATETLIESTAVDIVYDDGSPLTTSNFPNYATGWGEIDALAAVQLALTVCGPMGTLAGTVTTDAYAPVEGANIFADDGAGYTKNIYSGFDGSYSSGLPEGTYTLTASKYGYQSRTVTGVVITEDVTTVQDFSIPQLEASLVSGYVYDGGVVGVGAHGYPLYSSIHISATGFDETIYADPFTGYYEIDLLNSQPYSFDVQAVPPGYSMLSESVTPTGATYSKDFALIVGPSCSAPGYLKSLSATLSEGFDSGTLPAGWVNYDYIGNGQVWQFNDPRDRGNLTPGGEGGFAILDSDNYGSGYSQDAGLRTPVMDFTGEAGVVLDFDTDFNYWSSADSAIVWVSNDSGATWAPVWAQTTGFNGHVTIDISAQAANQADVIVEFNYIGSWGYWWQVDDVVISSIDCDLAEGGVVAGYVYDANDGSPLVEADVYSDVVATQTFFIPEDPASEGLYWVFHPVMGPPPINIQSLSGTNLVFDPTAGGAEGYVPGVPTTLCFESNVYSPDWEYVNHTWLKFPTDWTITDRYLVGTPTCDYGIWPYDPAFYWETEPYEIDIYHVAATNPGGDHCVAEYCVDVTPGASAGLVSWYYDGDAFGSPPHHPCSSDVYTPASMVDNECDEWVNPQASIPAIGGEVHDFTAEKALYGSDTETVIVFEDFIVRQDFHLGTGELSFAPTSFEVTMTMGDAAQTETLTISNLGTVDALFELVEKDEGYLVPTLMIPAFKSEHPEDTRPVSIGLAPDAGKASALTASEDNPFKGLLAGEPAFAIDVYPGYDLVHIPDTTIPGTWTIIGPVSESSQYFAGDFVGGDFSTLYVVDYGDNNLYAIDTATAAMTAIGPTTPPGGQTFSGLTGTPDGTMFGLTTTCSASNLVVVDVATGATTDLGGLGGIGCGIDLAYNTEDDMIYIVDLLTDSLFKVDPATVMVTEVGSLGVGANYAQGMDYEEESGVLYWAAFTTQGELRMIDTTTGASTLVGAFPGGAEVDSLAFATGGVSDVPWLSENPVSGTVPALGSITVDVIFDPTTAGLSQPGDYLAALKVKHDTPYTYPNIPVVLHLLPPDTYGTFNGTVTGLEVCDLNPMPLDGATVNFWQGTTIVGTTTTNGSGYFSYALPAGTYDIEFVMDGYVIDFAEEIELAAQSTVTVDMELRLDAPCLSVDPTSFEQTQPTDTTTTQTLTIINTGAGDAIVELMEIDGGFQPPAGSILGKVPSYQYSPERDLPGLDKSKTMTIEQISHPGISADLLDVLINEGFETLFPPSGWTQTITNPSYTWTQSSIYYYEGSYGAYVPWNYAQDEWLLTPELALAEGTLSLYSQGNVYWCRDTYDNCDLNVWLVVGEVGGGDDIFVKNLDEDWPENWVWTQATIDLAPFLPGEPVRIGFQLIGDDGADAAIDLVVLDGVEGLDVPWLTEDPVSVIVPANDSFDVTIGFDSKGLVEGDYSATLRIKEHSGVNVNVPVTLHVTEPIPLTVTADPATKVYGDADPVFTYSASDSSVPLTGALSREPGENVGTYKITLGTLDAGEQYAISFVPADFTITARPITITADDKEKIAGDPDPALTYQVTSGSLAGDDEIIGELARDPGEDAGIYDILIGTLEIVDGNNGDNYALTFVKGTFTIKQGTTSLYLPLILK